MSNLLLFEVDTDLHGLIALPEERAISSFPASPISRASPETAPTEALENPVFCAGASTTNNVITNNA
jgi:hypothetical protein